MSDIVPLNLAVIVGSTRSGRIGPRVAAWLADRAGDHDDLRVDVIDLAEAALPSDLDASSPQVTALAPRLARADAFVVVTPEYNHSFPAPLKTAIDCFRTEWQAKPLGFVSYGGVSGGLRAVEQLRQVFAETHTVGVRDTVSFHNVWEQMGEQGEFPVEPAGCDAAAKTMLDQLVWWARTLRAGRQAHPYSV
ncbi:NADPH-dependent FMN reductase [Streptomyces sp. 3214.6]|uniref:NADPH-dependent FMN reductase n=1 Tax=Streptomyces sp. 3214.6 TaxID=1882757 RepID=UPI00090A6843|nr:NAD(P)H-dependent oxidoreductase [Streptomyces sp. 3214.6]SHH51378.1 NAD(P)H-dependent FMN reductase [Streptomyces sp. 3214.6]